MTSIRAAATGLQTLDPSRTEDYQELTAVISEEADRLSQLVTEAVKMAEIDAGKVELQRAVISTKDLLEAARQAFDERGAERIRIEDEVDASLQVDRELITLALRQVLDNALKCSEPFSAISCRVEVRDADLILRVEDRGRAFPAGTANASLKSSTGEPIRPTECPAPGWACGSNPPRPKARHTASTCRGRESVGHEHGPRPRGG